MLQLSINQDSVLNVALIAEDVVVHEVYDFRRGLPPMPMLRVIYRKHNRYLQIIKHLSDNTYIVSDVVPMPAQEEWRPISCEMDLSKEQAEQFLLEWAWR